ncbi:uncharacterized protein LOC135843902 isoform X1 [Planococcus citri]|uniref:uncharacterized protein LOC135843902 isoform X1 n=1 Tax=Planococcus citri TaxID=170843 RepID=UPI0031F7D44B
MIPITNLFQLLPTYTVIILLLTTHSVDLDQSSEYFDESSSERIERPKVYTSLAIKEGVDKLDGINGTIIIGASTYWDLVKGSKIFLDTSLFIEEVLKNYTSATTLLVCPNKWGKTMNLDMLKFFLEIQVDQDGNKLPRENTTSYRLFKRSEIVYNDTFTRKLQSPLLISKKTVLVDRHQGKYPVVYFSLKEAIGDDLDSIREGVRKSLSRSFQQHKYLIHQELKKEHYRNSEHLLLFEQMLHGTAKNEDMPDGIILLCCTLEAYFRKKPILLIDDYDSFIHHLFRRNRHNSQELKEIMKFMVEIVDSALRQNLHMDIGIATGVLQINAYQWQYHNYTVYVNDRDKPISEYFGFNRSSVQEIFNQVGISAELASKAHNWYKGYAFEEPSKFYYNPWSLAWFLRTKSLQCHRQEGHRETFIQNVLRNNQTIRNNILQVLSRMIVSAEHHYPYMINDLEGIRLYGSHLMTYLTDKGYLSKISNNPLSNGTSQNKLFMDSVSISNNENLHQVASWMMAYCVQEYDIHPLVFNWAGVYLKKVIESHFNSSNIQTFIKTLENVYKNASDLSSKINPSDEYIFASQEHPVNLIFDCICLRMQQETWYEYEVYYKKLLKADIVAINRQKKHAAIIQLKYKHDSPERAMAHAEIYQFVIDEHANDDVETLLLVGISVSTNYTVRMDTNLIERKSRRPIVT